MRNKLEFWRLRITIDEIWIHRYSPETQSKQWTTKGDLMTIVF